MHKLHVPAHKAVVLLADDMQSIRSLAKTALKHIGFKKFVECSNGAEAIKRLKLMKVDLIICDYDMPERNGLDVLRFCRQQKHAEKLPFIMLTANASASLVHECISSGVDGYIVKPFQPEKFYRKIQKLLPRMPVARK